ncbi:MAG: YicC family protein [Saprospiraceae bacterium]|nr:YicC family protein [Saprospiraceae bacterium]
MIYSMTGFGKAESSDEKFKIVVELKSLNSKTNEIRIKLPSGYNEKELTVRNIILSELERGKIDLTLTNDISNGTNLTINSALFKDYYIKLNQLADEVGEKNKDFFPSIVRIPNIFKESEYKLSDEEWNIAEKTITDAIVKIKAFRAKEGESIKSDLINSLEGISGRLEEIESLDIERKKILRSKMDSMITEMEQNNKVDKDRFEQEVMFYLEKLDINEEKIRLSQHCKYFLDVLLDKNFVSKGRKLSFISQELGREINTLGAKAQFTPLQMIVVEMKDNLEKIKEQLANVL